MQCPTCRTRLILRYKYRVQGKRYNTLPGVKRVYSCAACQREYRSVEIYSDHLQEWAAQWEQQRNEWIREKARLEQKLYWLNQPSTYAERRLFEIRKSLVHLIEHTF